MKLSPQDHVPPKRQLWLAMPQIRRTMSHRSHWELAHQLLQMASKQGLHGM